MKSRSLSQRLRSLAWALALTCSPGVAWAGSLVPGLNFTGGTRSEDLTAAETNAPDSMGAVGPDEIVYLVNNGYKVFRKSDGAEVASDTFKGFWAAAGVPLVDGFDPRIQYDPSSGRFFAAAVQQEPVLPNHMMVAVSKSSDPRDGWSGFSVEITPGLVNADFPQVGLDADGFYVSYQRGPVGQAEMLVFPKADLLAATPTITRKTILSVSANEAGFFPQPVTNLDGGGLPTQLLAGTLTYFGAIQSATLAGPVTAPSLSANPVIVIPPVLKPTPAEQPGGVPLGDIDLPDSRFGSSIIQRDGAIWAVHMIRTESGRDALQWFKLDAATDIVLHSGVITDPNLDLIYPSLAVNEFGEVVIGFTGTGKQQFPSAYAVLGETVGDVTTFGAPLLLKQGTASYEALDDFGRARFGDYSVTVVDPEDPHTFWTFQEWALSKDDWAVQITQLLAVPEPGTAVLLTAGLAVIARSRRRVH